MQMKFNSLSTIGTVYTFKDIGLFYGDPSSEKSTTSNHVNINVNVKAKDYFDWFRQHRGETITPVTISGAPKSSIYIYTLDEILDGLKPTIISTIFSTNEEAKRQFYDECLVGFRVSATNPDNTEVHYDDYAGRWDSFDELQEWSKFFGRGSVSMSNFTAWRNGLGFWYSPANDLWYIGSAYEKFYNDTSGDKKFYAYTDSVAPFIQLAGQQSLGDKRYAMSTHTYIGHGATTNLSAILDTIYPTYKDESSSFRGYFNNATSQVHRYFLSNAVKPEPEKPDYPTPTPQEEEGGKGNFDDTTDDIPIPELPTIALGNMVNVYKVDNSNQTALHNYLWSEDFIDSFLKGINQDPFSCLVGLQYMPIAPTTASSSIQLGNVNTDISAQKVPNRAWEIDFGVVSLAEYWGNFLDYNPYTTVELYCPYCSTVTLDTDVVMNSTIGLKYRIDILSGGITGFITANNQVIATVSGNCATQVPLTVNDKSQMINNTISGLMGLGLSAGAGSVSGMLSSTASIVASQKTHPQIKSNYSGNLGSLGIQYPYLIITRPIASIPSDFAHNKGFRSNITRKLSDVSGYTRVDSIHLDSIPCTQSEREEIETLLKNGVIL